MLKRTISTLGLWALVLALLYFFGTTGAIWIVTFIAVLTLWEFYALLKYMGFAPFDKLATLLGASIVLAPTYLARFNVQTIDLLALSTVIFSIRLLGEREPQNRVETLAASLFGLVYVAVMMHYLVLILQIASPLPTTGIALFLWVVAVSKFCDVGALLSGMAFGKHKMSPVISPKKTWEGAIGGLFVSALVGTSIAYWAHHYMPVRFTPLVAGLFAVPLAALGIVADLVESVIKRRASLKDSGATIPGIGGMFDLTDSLILTAPAGYFIFHLLSSSA